MKLSAKELTKREVYGARARYYAELLRKTGAQEPMTMTQNGTTTAPRPQLGDIIIHNYGALVYIGTIERFCTHNPNMVEGPALVVTSDDGKFYECQAAHYFDLRTCKVVSKPPVMPFEGETVPEANVPAAAAVAGVDELIDIPRVLGSNPDEEPF